MAQLQATYVARVRARMYGTRRTDLSRAWLVALRCSASEILRASLIFLSVCGGGQSNRRHAGMGGAVRERRLAHTSLKTFFWSSLIDAVNV